MYFDIKEGKSCTNYHEDNSKTGYNGIYEGDNSTKTTDNQNNCLKFYAFLDDGGEKLNLLLDHNTTATIEWINKTDFDSSGGIVTDSLKNDYGSCMFEGICVGNNIGPITLLKQLYEDTKVWNVPVILKDYTLNQSNQPNQANYAIEYSKIPSYEGATTSYKARLITAQEIAQITGADKLLSWDETSTTSDWYYFDSLSTTPSDICTTGNITGCKHGWLYDRTRNDCLTNGCLNNSDVSTNGYWTSSACASNSNSAWIVHFDSNVSTSSVHLMGIYGIRPVIEVLKSKL